jgi:hypothetical protein
MQMQMQLSYQRELNVLLMRRTLPNAFHATPYAKSQPAANAYTKFIKPWTERTGYHRNPPL